MAPIVSVIIIFLDARRFLEEAVQSVLSQTHEHWELILVDDGSTDGSTELARSYAERRPDQIRYVDHAGHANLGMGASRNRGIREARADYIAFLDADDTWVPEKLTRQIAMLSTEPDAVMVYGRTLMWHSWGAEGQRLGEDHLTGLGVRPNRVVDPPELLLLALQNNGPVPSNSNALWRRAIVEEIGAFEERFAGAYSDLPFYVKVLRRYPVLVVSDCWDRYRQHERNFVRQAKAAGHWHPDEPNQARADVLAWIARYFSDTSERREAVLAVLRRESFPYRHPWLYHALRQLGRARDAGGMPLTASVRWDVHGARNVEVRINTPDGPLFAAGGARGSAVTGRWVRDGTTFLVQDVTNGLPLTSVNTLASTSVWITSNGCVVEPRPPDSPATSETDGGRSATLQVNVQERGRHGR